MAFKSYKKESRTDWGTENDGLTLVQIQTGAILRIADSLEKMEKPFTELLREVKRLKGTVESLQGWNESLLRSNAGLRGHLNRIKRK